jgi:ABC-type dipeptide/oligopeptide/nickel transport system permease component
MIRYIGRRLSQAAFVLWLAASLAFVALQLTPGDPAQVLLAASGATSEQVAALREQLNLDDPLPVQYLYYIGDLIRGDLGESWLHRRSVGQIIWEQLPATIELATAALVVGLSTGVGVGMLSAVWRVTWLDTLVTAVSTIGFSTPTYWSGLLAILLFSLTLRWLPPGGTGSLRHLVLPALILGFSLSGSIARLVRARVAEVIERPFVVAARARGLPAWRILFLHVLRPAVGPTIAVTALQFGFLLSGAVVTESVFARRGLGKLALEAILTKDIPVVRGIVLVGAVSYILVNLVADMILAWLDPRLQTKPL